MEKILWVKRLPLVLFMAAYRICIASIVGSCVVYTVVCNNQLV